jgi:hypothetical protein
VIGVSNAYLSGEADVAGVLRGTRARIMPVLVAVLLKWLFIGLAFMAGLIIAMLVSALLMMLIALVGGGTAVAGIVGVMAMLVLALPVGLYAFAAMFAVPATVVLEGRGALDGLRRSRELSRGLKPRIIGALGVPMLGFLVFQLFIGGLGTLLPGPSAISLLFEQAITIAVYPIIAVIATLLYYDARIRKEGFDIEVMAAELEPAAERPSTYSPSEHA